MVSPTAMLGSWIDALIEDCLSISMNFPPSCLLHRFIFRTFDCRASLGNPHQVMSLAILCIFMHNIQMKEVSENIDVDSLIGIAKAKRMTQAQIASAIGASQSQVSRVLSGYSKKRSRLTKKICNYVKNLTPVVSIESVRLNEELMAALAATWDGTPKHSEALATVIRSLRVLSAEEPRPDKKSRNTS
jgi:transcriptional regulator with XRE-family HTH domain